MKRVAAIAALAIKSAIRSRLFFWLVLLVVMSVFALPVLVSDDGSAQGMIRIRLRYSLTLAMFILSIAVVWLSVRVSAVEVEEKQMQLLTTKPVSCAATWFGKWVGILAMIAVLLAISALCSYGLVRWAVRPSRLNGEDRLALDREVFTARLSLRPEPRDVGDEPRADAEPIPPLEGKAWTFRLPKKAGWDGPFYIHFRVSSPRQLDMRPVSVRWKAGPPEDPDRCVIERSLPAGGFRSVAIPVSAAGGGDALCVEYVNSQTNPPAGAVLRDDEVFLLARAGSFEANLFRAVAIMFFGLAALAALGLAMGGIFSAPVAVFASLAILVVFMFGDFIGAAAADSDMLMYRPISTVSTFDSALETWFRFMNAIVGPVTRFDVLPLVVSGRLVAWAEVGRAFAVLVAGYAGFFLAAGMVLFKRRELGVAAER